MMVIDSIFQNSTLTLRSPLMNTKKRAIYMPREFSNVMFYESANYYRQYSFSF
jgi:hypothetical protein